MFSVISKFVNRIGTITRIRAALPWTCALWMCALLAPDSWSPAAGQTPVAHAIEPHPAVTALNATAPPLLALQHKLVSKEWLVAWLMKPSLLRPGTTMPDSKLTAEEALAMATYLYAGSAPPDDRGSWRGGDPAAGARLFVSRGCRGCHAIAPGRASISPHVPNLTGTGLKVRGDWLFAWIKSPRKYNPDTAMPDLGLEDPEVRDLVAFLMDHREGESVLAEMPHPDRAGDAAAGKALLEQYECGTCHRMRGFPDPDPPFSLSAAGSADRETALREGRLLIDFYNCRGCHRVAGEGGLITAHLERKTMAPPTLEGEGKRVQPSWLIEFLQQPRVLRPWLEMRMPDFGLSDARATVLARYFAALAGASVEDEPIEESAAEVNEYGLRRFGSFQCIQCHPASENARPGADPDRVAINLALAKNRLRPSWVREFLARPKDLVGAETRMPSVFYRRDGTSKVADPERDITSITAYLMHMTEPPGAALGKLEAARKKEEQHEPIDWTTYDY